MTWQPGKTVTEVAKELGIPWKTRVRARPVSRDARLRPVSGWVGRWNKQGESAFLEPFNRARPAEKHTLSTKELEAENQRLRRENETLRQEWEIPKKATAFFARELK